VALGNEGKWHLGTRGISLPLLAGGGRGEVEISTPGKGVPTPPPSRRGQGGGRNIN